MLLQDTKNKSLDYNYLGLDLNVRWKGAVHSEWLLFDLVDKFQPLDSVHDLNSEHQATMNRITITTIPRE